MLRPTRFSHMRLCDSWNADDTPCASGERVYARIDLALVDAVPELVQAREDPVQRVLVEVRRQADVGGRERRRERVHRAVEPPGGAVHPPALEHPEREAALRVAREVAAQARVVDRLGVADSARARAGGLPSARRRSSRPRASSCRARSRRARCRTGRRAGSKQATYCRRSSRLRSRCGSMMA